MRDLTPATALSQPATGPVDGATVVIEAATAEAALTELHETFGADARIVEVRRIARGGIGGFFARELVELHAAPGDAAPAVPTAASAPVAAGAPAAAAAPTAAATAPRPLATGASLAAASAYGGAVAASPIERLLQADDRALDTVDFATYLRGQLGDAPAVAAAPTEPAATHEALLERATAAARMAVQSATGELDGGGVVDPATDRVVGAPAPAPVTVPAATATPAVAPEVTLAAAPAQVLAAAPAPAQVLAAADPVAVVHEEPAADVSSVASTDEMSEPAASTEAGPAWSVGALVKLGLPAGLVRGLVVEAPADDVAWTAALAGALRPVCRPLPTGKSLLIGPRARSIAAGLRIPVTAAGQPIRSRAATVAAAIGSGAASHRWLEKVRGTRWIHVVVGGKGWRELLHFDPLAVSWATAQDVPEAIRLATELGLVLGAGPIDGEVRRARPLDVALAVRALLPVTDGVAPAAATGTEQL